MIRKVKIYVLAYADDIVLLADRPSELAEMLRLLKRYCERKDMVINVDKSKVQRFCNGGTVARELQQRISKESALKIIYLSNRRMEGRVR